MVSSPFSWFPPCLPGPLSSLQSLSCLGLVLLQAFPVVIVRGTAMKQLLSVAVLLSALTGFSIASVQGGRCTRAPTGRCAGRRRRVRRDRRRVAAVTRRCLRRNPSCGRPESRRCCSSAAAARITSQFFNATDTATLTAAGFSINYTEDRDQAVAEIARLTSPC